MTSITSSVLVPGKTANAGVGEGDQGPVAEAGARPLLQPRVGERYQEQRCPPIKTELSLLTDFNDNFCAFLIDKIVFKR